MKKTVVIPIAGLLLLFSCKKPEDRRCWKSTGEQTEREITLDSFDRLQLGPHLAYTIVQDSLDKVVIYGGRNLVNLVDCETENGLLTIRNRNKCAFLRKSTKGLVAEIHCTSVKNIRYEGTEYLKSAGVIHSDYFTLLIRDGAGPVDLTLNALVIDADISHGWGDYTLHGTAQLARIGARSNGYCDVFDLVVTDSMYVASETPGTIKVNANGIPLAGYIKGSGNVWYKGTPASINVICTGEGKVLNKN